MYPVMAIEFTLTREAARRISDPGRPPATWPDTKFDIEGNESVEPLSYRFRIITKGLRGVYWYVQKTDELGAPLWVRPPSGFEYQGLNINSDVVFGLAFSLLVRRGNEHRAERIEKQTRTGALLVDLGEI